MADIVERLRAHANSLRMHSHDPLHLIATEWDAAADEIERIREAIAGQEDKYRRLYQQRRKTVKELKAQGASFQRLRDRLAAAEAVCEYFRDDTELAAFGNYRVERVFDEKVARWREVTR